MLVVLLLPYSCTAYGEGEEAKCAGRPLLLLPCNRRGLAPSHEGVLLPLLL